MFINLELLHFKCHSRPETKSKLNLMIEDGGFMFYSTEPHHGPIFCFSILSLNPPILPLILPILGVCLKTFWSEPHLNYTNTLFVFKRATTQLLYSGLCFNNIKFSTKNTIFFSVLDTVYQNNCYKSPFYVASFIFFDFSNFSNSTLLDLFQSWLYRQLYKLCFFSWNRVFILHYKTLDWLFHCFYSLIIA